MYDSGYDSGENDGAPEDFKDRHKCTDICCCAAWVIALILFAVTIGYGYVNGNPKKLHHGIDSLGRVCGVDAGVELKPYTFYCAPKGWLNGALTAAGMNFLANPVCVTQCPVRQLVANNTNNTVPKPTGDNGSVFYPATVPECGANLSTAPYVTKASFYYCVPDSGIHKAAADSFTQATSSAKDRFWKAIDTISKGNTIYVCIFFLAIVLGFLYVGFLSACARPMVYIAIIVIFLASLGTGIWMIAQAQEIGTNKVLESFGSFSTSVAYTIGILCLIVAFVTCCMFCGCSEQVDDAVRAVEMTADVLTSMPSLLLGPVVQAISKVIMMMVLLIGFVYLVSVAKPTQATPTSMRTFEWTSTEQYMIMYYVVMFFWVLCFSTAVYQFAMAYATADYYYTEELGDGARDVGACAVCEGLFVGLMYHSGSLALGSLIIAIFAIIQRCIEYVDKTAGSTNPVVKVIATVAYCITCCFRSCAEFINKNAYIDMAIYSHSFCRAAGSAIAAFASRPAAFAILGQATAFFQLLGTLLISAICGLVTYGVTQMSTYSDPTSASFLPNPILVVIVASLLGFGMAKIFMDVLDMVSSTLVFCFALEGGNPSSAKCPPSVKNALQECDNDQRGRE